MLNVYPMFAYLMANETLVDVDNTKLLEYAYKLKNENSYGRHHSNRLGWQSDYVEDAQELQDLLSAIKNTFIEPEDALREMYGFKKNTGLFIDSAWININTPYSYNAPHSHPGSFLSGVYYVKVPENSGGLFFNSPSPVQGMYTPQHLIFHFSPHNCLKWNIPNQESQALIFPAWMEHYVSQNLSKEDRVSIAFNISVVGNDK